MFAGEDVECTITFKNVAPALRTDKQQSPSPPKFAPGPERQRKLPPVQSSTRPSISRQTSLSSQQHGGPPPQHLRGHRPNLSLSTPSIGASRSPGLPSAGLPNGSSSPAQAHRHQRSLSIISLGTDQPAEPNGPPRRPARGHARSASLQVVPGRANQFGGIPRHSQDGKDPMLTPRSRRTQDCNASFSTIRRRHVSPDYTRTPSRVLLPHAPRATKSRHPYHSRHRQHHPKAVEFHIPQLQVPSYAVPRGPRNQSAKTAAASPWKLAPATGRCIAQPELGGHFTRRASTIWV